MNKKTKKNDTKIQYKNKSTLDLTGKEIQDCSTLYSQNYGTYSSKSPIRPGQQIHISAKRYKDLYRKNNYYVALAYKNKNLIGHAFYLRQKASNNKFITWIIQLVVSKKYQRQGIAKKLMQSIWGFSDDYAWGLVTPNIYTIKTLESTTFRKCAPKVINNNIKEIKELAESIYFIPEGSFDVTDCHSIVNSNFFVERTLNIEDAYQDNWVLGNLPEGHEWLAFIFNEQEINIDKYHQRFSELINFSEEKLKDAYSRMKIKKHPWAQRHDKEVTTIINETKISNHAEILDLGCGIGRHAIEFAKRNYNVAGVDFSEKHIKYARKEKRRIGLKNIKFYNSDIRTFKSRKRFDLITCLYDVVGSFPDNKDNVAIIKKAYKLLKENGYFILSVMNMELTNRLVPESQKGDLSKKPEILINLKPSTAMMNTGNIFNPDYLAIDTNLNLVYRKEQFNSYRNNGLPAEYIIRDKRYTLEEISEILKNEGFKIIISKFVNANDFDTLLPHDEAKEILLICQK